MLPIRGTAVSRARSRVVWSGEAQTFTDGRSYKTLYLVEQEPLMTGQADTASRVRPRLTNQPIVSMDFTSEGKP